MRRPYQPIVIGNGQKQITVSVVLARPRSPCSRCRSRRLLDRQSCKLARRLSRPTAIPEEAPLRCADLEIQQRTIELIDQRREAGDTLGGVFEVVARGLLPGLGSHTSWDFKVGWSPGAGGDVDSGD